MTNEQIVKRAFYLAFIACGGTTGMGFLQDNPDATEEDIWEQVKPGKYNPDPYGDYVFGRMMKLSIPFTEDSITVKESKPRVDYQGWCKVYPAYASLIDAAKESLSNSMAA